MKSHTRGDINAQGLYYWGVDNKRKIPEMWISEEKFLYRRALDKKRRTKNKDSINKQRREWHNKNKDRINIYRKKSADKNRDTIRQKAKAKYYLDVDKSRKYSREKAKACYYRNVEKYRERAKEYARNNQEKIKEKGRRERKDPNIIKRIKEYKKNNHQRLLDYAAKYVSVITNSYVAAQLGVPVSILRKHQDLIDAKREQIKILRELKPKIRKKKHNAQEPEQPATSPR